MVIWEDFENTSAYLVFGEDWPKIRDLGQFDGV